MNETENFEKNEKPCEDGSHTDLELDENLMRKFHHHFPEHPLPEGPGLKKMLVLGMLAPFLS